MNRREMLASIGVFSVAGSVLGGSEAGEKSQDRWVGRYLKFAEYDTDRSGQFGEAQRVEITKTEKGYALSKPYDAFGFSEEKQGVLTGKYGKLVLGSVRYEDGLTVPALRAEFCYEDFVLYRDVRGEGGGGVKEGDESKAGLYPGIASISVRELNDLLNAKGYQPGILGKQIQFRCRAYPFKGMLDEKSRPFAEIEGVEKFPQARLVDLPFAVEREMKLEVHGLFVEQNYGVWTIWVYSTKVIT